jgi:hypothetical protein
MWHHTSPEQEQTMRVRHSNSSEGRDSYTTYDNRWDKLTRSKSRRHSYYENAAQILAQRKTPISNSSSDDDLENGEATEDDDPSSKKKKKMMMMHSRKPKWLRHMGYNAKAEYDFFVEFVKPHKKRIFGLFVKGLWMCIVPSLVVAGLLFYVFGNPPVGFALIECTALADLKPNTTTYDLFPWDGQPLPPTPAPTPQPAPFPTITPTVVNFTHPPGVVESPSTAPTREPSYSVFDKNDSELCIDEEKSLEKASYSWWILFIGCRQLITLAFARLSQLFFIDFFVLQTKCLPRILGTAISLGIAQSKGWPFTLFSWAIFDLILLYGYRQFSRHWLYWQSLIDIFNATNPSGNVTDNDFYKRVIYVSIGLSIAVTIKRALVGNLVGKRVVGKCSRKMSLHVTERSSNSFLSHIPSLLPSYPLRLDQEAFTRW